MAYDFKHISKYIVWEQPLHCAMFNLTLPFLYNIDVENGPPVFYFISSVIM